MPPPLSLLLLLLVIGAVTAGGAIVVMARALTRPPRMTDGKALYVLKRVSPADLGLAFEDVRFDVRDHRTGSPLKLAAWWIPHAHANGRCVVIVHGYADAKVGAIAWAPTWHAMGFNVLAIDLRAHGESTGRVCTGGFDERYDLADVCDRLRAERPEAARVIVLFGISLGATTALGAAALREDVADAVVLDSPVADFRTAALSHFDLLGLPGGPLARGAWRMAQWMTDADAREVRPAGLLARARCPVMVVAPAEDVFVTPDEARELAGALTARGETRDVYWHVDGTRHLEALYANPQEYRERLQRFVESALPGEVPFAKMTSPAESPG